MQLLIPDDDLRLLALTPRTPAREVFAIDPPPEPTALERDALVHFNRGRQAVGLAPAVLDPLLGEVAEAYARLLAREGGEAAAAAVDPLFDWVGLVDVYPTFHALEAVAGGDAGFFAQLEQLGRLGAGRPEQEREPGEEVLGVGRSTELGRWIHVAVVLRRLLRLAPLARRPPAGRTVQVVGQAAPGIEQLQGHWLIPGGQIEPLPVRLDAGSRLELQLTMPDRPGWALVELTGVTALGPRVLSRFALDSRPAGEPAPLQLQLAPRGEASLTTEQATARLGALLARARAAVGAPALRLDPLASAVARVHARQMAEQQFTGHRAPSGGTPGERFRQAGLGLSLLAECVARDRSVSAALLALFRSLAHRQILLDARFSAAGLAAFPQPQEGGVEWLVVCDLFRPLQHPHPELAPGELIEEIAGLRRRAGVGPLLHDPALRGAARRLGEQLVYLAPGQTVELDPLLTPLLPREPGLVGRAIARAVPDPWLVARADPALLDPAWTHLGLELRPLDLGGEEGPTPWLVVLVLGRRMGD